MKFGMCKQSSTYETALSALGSPQRIGEQQPCGTARVRRLAIASGLAAEKLNRGPLGEVFS
jgi:hypothetical protein